ncbi:MAG TPA: DUF3352 domain-containing protein, partial [Candidatus Limnocylindrales bacterium]|nr:DUF3352 domain-containing protein [Candidatus Limnocylindrales bacterium]
MLHRLAIALTTLLGLVGAAVVAGYLLVFAVGTDRMAAAVPADAATYATVYLQPTTGQQMNLATLMSNVPGFADAASLDQKIHEISARFLGQAGIDYEADVRPWIGNQLSIAAKPGAALADQPRWLLLASVKDAALAREALDRIATGRGLTGAGATYQEVPITIAQGLAWAVQPDLLILAPDRAALAEALDAYADRRPSLADKPEYIVAMRRLPADHLAAAYLDLEALAEAAGIGDQLSGYSAVGAALMAEPT